MKRSIICALVLVLAAGHVAGLDDPGGKPLDLMVGNWESEGASGIALSDFGAPNRKLGKLCRNTDQTGRGDGKAGYGGIVFEVPDRGNDHVLRMTVWGRSSLKKVLLRKPTDTKDERTWTYISPKTQLSGEARWEVLEYPLSARATAQLPSPLRVGFGGGDSQILVHRIEVAVAEEPRKPAPAPDEAAGGDITVRVVTAITDVKILPDASELPGRVSNEIWVAACPGEYEPVSFVVRAERDITALTVTPAPLRGEAGAIPAANVDIRVVKCWYQSGERTAFNGRRLLTPELLLKDDSLVRVDYENKENHLKLTYPSGETKYVSITSPETKPEFRSSGAVLPNDEFPVRDSAGLLPVDIPAGTNRQFWVTVKVPEDAAPGVYDGRIELKAGDMPVGGLSLHLRVLPFALARPPLTYSIYYLGRLDSTGKGTISSNVKSPAQFRAEMRNLAQHGVASPGLHQGFDEKLLDEALKIRADEGIDNRDLYYMGWGSSFSRFMHFNWSDLPKDETLKVIRERARRTIDFCAARGTERVYFYGIDEATGAVLRAERPAWQAVREAGGGIFVAGYVGHFETVGDLLDVLVCAGYPNEEEAALFHSIGHRIWCYGNPQGGWEDPEIYRRNFGLLLWKKDYDGACTFAYQCGFGNIWDDFDSPKYRDHNFTYPTVDGVVDTVAWEGFREGVDDVRYVATLLEEIKKAKRSDDRQMKKAAIAAERHLEEIDVDTGDLDTIRLEMIHHILELRRAK